MRSRQSLRTVRTQRSANAFAFGARTGVRITLIPSEQKTSSKARLNFASRSWISSWNGCSCGQLHDDVPGLLSHPGAVWVGCTGDELEPALCQREEEEH
jgi:hypothetical protein